MSVVTRLASLPQRLPPELIGTLTLTASGGGQTSGTAAAITTERQQDAFSGEQTTKLDRLQVYLWPAGLSFVPEPGQSALWAGVSYLVQEPVESIAPAGSVAIYRLTLARP